MYRDCSSQRVQADCHHADRDRKDIHVFLFSRKKNSEEETVQSVKAISDCRKQTNKQ